MGNITLRNGYGQDEELKISRSPKLETVIEKSCEKQSVNLLGLWHPSWIDPGTWTAQFLGSDAQMLCLPTYLHQYSRRHQILMQDISRWRWKFPIHASIQQQEHDRPNSTLKQLFPLFVCLWSWMLQSFET